MLPDSESPSLANAAWGQADLWAPRRESLENKAQVKQMLHTHLCPRASSLHPHDAKRPLPALGPRGTGSGAPARLCKLCSTGVSKGPAGQAGVSGAPT